MSAPRDETPEAELARVVLEVSGVTDVFSPAGVVEQVPGIVTSLVTTLVTGDADQPARVRVRTSAQGTAIATRIAADRSASAPAAARGVADALLEVAPAGGEVTVSVEVSRIS